MGRVLMVLVAAGCRVGYEDPAVQVPTDGSPGIDVVVPPGCGDGVLEAPEECDDGDDDRDDGCVDCRFARCGDGIVRANVEGCDDANSDGTDGCTGRCVVCDHPADAIFAQGGRCYSYHGNAVPWSSADDLCRAFGGHLATYDTRAENDAVAAGLALPSAAWFGLLSVNSIWVWFDYEDLLFTNWAVGEPGATGGAGTQLPDGTWAADVSTVAYPVICERDELEWYIAPDTNHAYDWMPDAVTWEVAEGTCQLLGGHVLTVETSAEHAFIAASEPGYVWLSGSDMGEEGVWLWGNGNAIGFANWVTGQPDGSGDCLLWLSDATWDDADCAETHPFICELE